MDSKGLQKRGKFITFEGTEGVGKSTQINLFADHLRALGLPVIVTKEPGGTSFGEVIRSMILDKNTTFHSPFTEIMLFIADRLEHVAFLVEPALAAGTWVVCDRYIDSTIAYQIGGRRMPEDLIQILQRLTPLTPDVTFLLDLPVDEGISRAKNRATLDRFEREEMAFHERIRETYLSLATSNSQRIKVISALGSVGDVSQRIQSCFEALSLKDN